jgi:hypothetical protein
MNYPKPQVLNLKETTPGRYTYVPGYTHHIKSEKSVGLMDQLSEATGLSKPALAGIAIGIVGLILAFDNKTKKRR